MALYFLSYSKFIKNVAIKTPINHEISLQNLQKTKFMLENELVYYMYYMSSINYKKK